MLLSSLVFISVDTSSIHEIRGFPSLIILPLSGGLHSIVFRDNFFIHSSQLNLQLSCLYLLDPISNYQYCFCIIIIIIIIIILIILLIYIEYQCFHLFLCLYSFNFIWLLHSSILLITLAFMSVVTSCIHEIWDVAFLLLLILGGHHSKMFRGRSFFIRFSHVTIPAQLFISYVI